MVGGDLGGANWESFSGLRWWGGWWRSKGFRKGAKKLVLSGLCALVANRASGAGFDRGSAHLASSSPQRNVCTSSAGGYARRVAVPRQTCSPHERLLCGMREKHWLTGGLESGGECISSKMGPGVGNLCRVPPSGRMETCHDVQSCMHRAVVPRFEAPVQPAPDVHTHHTSAACLFGVGTLSTVVCWGGFCTCCLATLAPECPKKQSTRAMAFNVLMLSSGCNSH